MKLIKNILNGEKVKSKFTWILFLWTGFLILVIQDWRNLKYIFNLFRELCRIFSKNSGYYEDSDFILIHKDKLKL
jgi:hypothetical protein